MTSKSLKVVALGLLFVLSAPAAFAAPLTNVNCSFADGDETQCVEQAIDITYKAPNPIGVVAYAPTTCSYFIVHDRAKGTFVLARDKDRRDNATRGEFIYANRHERGNDFKTGATRLMLGTTELHAWVFTNGLTASEAAAAYTAKCSR